MNLNIKIAKESAISFFGMGFGQISRYLFTTLLARWVGVELLGFYSISNAITRISEVIGKLGLDQGILRQVSREESLETKKEVILSALKIGFISGIIIMIIQIIFAEYLAKNIFNQSAFLTKVITLHAISLPFYIIIHISGFSTQAYKLLKYKILVTEIQNPLILLLVMIFCYFFYTIESMIIIPVLISAFFGLLSMSIFLKNISGVNILHITKGIFDRELLNYSLPIMFMATLGIVLHWTDVLMLGYFTDPITVGLYHPAARTAGIVRIILLSFVGIYGPIIAEMYSKNKLKEMNHLYKVVTRRIITFALPFVILILLYPKKIMLIFGSDFVIGYPILMILVIGAFIQSVFGIGGTTLNMTGFPKINLYNTFIACGINIGLNIILIPNYSGEGAAFSTLITLSSIALIRGMQNWRLLALIPFSWKLIKPFTAGIIALVSGLLVKYLIIQFHTIVTLFLATFVVFIVFFVALHVIGLDEDDSEIFSIVKTAVYNYGLKLKK